MTVSERYGHIHQTIQEAARLHTLVVTDVRLLIAVAEANGSASTRELYELPGLNPTAIRRSSLKLRDLGYATATADDERGGPARCGCFVRLGLTAHGWAVADYVLNRVPESAAA